MENILKIKQWVWVADFLMIDLFLGQFCIQGSQI